MEGQRGGEAHGVADRPKIYLIAKRDKNNLLSLASLANIKLSNGSGLEWGASATHPIHWNQVQLPA
jgi:hypothetical protein